MRTFRFNKLVRDKIVGYHQEDGGSADYKVLDGKDYLEALKAKILEEAAEIDASSPDETLSELADVQEVIDAMLEAISKTKDELVAQQTKKRQKNGGFKKRHFINTVALPDDAEWINYYLKNSDKYPEVKNG